MSTALDLDLAAMVGDMEAPPCEHYQHGIPGFAHDDGPATHYVASGCTACDYAPPVRSTCSTYVAFIRANGPMKCSSCGCLGNAGDFMRILGPVNQ